MDEASQCDIASLLPLLFRAKAAVIIGDPKQLKHISSIPHGLGFTLLQQHGLEETLGLNWEYSVKSVFDLASTLASAEDIIMLRDHHRSHADIIEFSNKHFYENRLRIATNYDCLLRLPANGPAIRWINVEGRVTLPLSGSGALNESEAQKVVAVLERLILDRQYQGTIGVVTPFHAQRNRIREILNDHPHDNHFKSVLVDTVHGFQGDERDIMLFSPVVSRGISPGALRFF